jgi:hypothetical protein
MSRYWLIVQVTDFNNCYFTAQLFRVAAEIMYPFNRKSKITEQVSAAVMRPCQFQFRDSKWL